MSGVSSTGARLAFALRPFFRACWVSDQARDTWSEGFRHLSLALLETAVSDAVERGGALSRRRIPGWQVFRLQGLARECGFACDVKPYTFGEVARRPGLLFYDATFGAPEAVSSWIEDGAHDIPDIPACCRIAAQRDSRCSWLDPLWSAACDTPSVRKEGFELDLDAVPELNPLLERLGLGVLGWTPCHFECREAKALSRRLLDRGLSGPYRTEFEQLEEVMAWPARWSAVGGIAEIELPVARFATTTDATAGRRVLRWRGTRWPGDGVTGLEFPYRPPQSRRKRRSRPVRAAPVSAGESDDFPASDRPGPDRPRLPVPGRFLDPTIDWSRLAEPQADHYDTQIALALGGREAPAAVCEPTLFKGRVALRSADPGFLARLGWISADLRHPHIAEAASYVARWPVVRRQLEQLVTCVHPVENPGIPRALWGKLPGSQSHSFIEQPGHIYATIFDPLGLAQALVHELAHTKLYALGLGLEVDHHLIVNPKSELYDSPIRTDRQRPMSAVFHAEFSFIHVTELDIRLLKSEDDPDVRARLFHLLERNVRRMEIGHRVIRDHIKVDERGKPFVAGFLAWTERILQQGRSLLE